LSLAMSCLVASPMCKVTGVAFVFYTRQGNLEPPRYLRTCRADQVPVPKESLFACLPVVTLHQGRQYSEL
jgi:hypothetical protein